MKLKRNSTQYEVRFGELISNPGLDIFNIPAVAKVTQKHKVPLIVDGTFNTPICVSP